ncbi:hypothetical protein Bcep18194_B2162 [Burkholderia lata]|uniref:Uncharacterized protein n=1 Tax=Burkholderia lata (strain ATCC 17760 / DSM 23089 / LMG 22485 / NCIMB 9086 / R18194 / 383) TaxID=482957 RepID=Q393U3_BURL3|nr:hypothetical protein Bcep18194_B2162 [Burkholderia lata]
MRSTRPFFVHIRIRTCRVASFDHIVRRSTRQRPVAHDAFMHRSAPRSRTFRRRDERLARANVALCAPSYREPVPFASAAIACADDATHPRTRADVRTDSYGKWQLPERR